MATKRFIAFRYPHKDPEPDLSFVRRLFKPTIQCYKNARPLVLSVIDVTLIGIKFLWMLFLYRKLSTGRQLHMATINSNKIQIHVKRK